MKTSFFLLLAFGTFLSCQRGPEPGLDGIWQSLGSARIIQVQDSSFTVYDFTEISCFPVKEASLRDFGESIYIKNDTLCLDVGVLTYQYVRLEQLPELCSEPIPFEKQNDPVFNFQVFAQTVEENYAFLQLNQLNWDSIYQAQEKKLLQHPTDLNLYQVLDETLVFLNDNHGYLEASDSVGAQLEALEAPDSDISSLKEYGDFEIANIVFDNYVGKEMSGDSWLIKWGMMEDNTGFIQVKAMWLFADLELSAAKVEAEGFVNAYVDAFHALDEGQYIQKEVEGVRKWMDRIMADLAGTDRILIDVRFNGGGQDAVSLEILRYFNDQPKPVATEKLRFREGYTPVQEVWLSAAPGAAYLRPVYILTSPQTGSAAETFALASRSIPHINRVGASTSGALSTALEKTLPNGWAFSISNELFMDTNGEFYENRGIPPDISLEYPMDRQPFFRKVANAVREDKLQTLEAIRQWENRQ